MAEQIWVVVGGTGEYSDRREWFVCAYRDEASAVRHADLAAARALAYHQSTNRYSPRSVEAVLEAMGDLDPLAESMDYTGSDYDARPVELRDSSGAPGRTT